MAKQHPHEWNASLNHEVEKTARNTIHQARRVAQNKKSIEPAPLALEDADGIVCDLSDLVCTLLDIAEDQGVTPEMVARLMVKRAAGREQEVHRLLRQVKKEIKAEMRDSKTLTIARLDQKAHDIAMGKRNPKAKGRGKGPKPCKKSELSQQVAADTTISVEDETVVEEDGDLSNSRKRERVNVVSEISDSNKENKALAAGSEHATGSPNHHEALSSAKL